MKGDTFTLRDISEMKIMMARIEEKLNNRAQEILNLKQKDEEQDIKILELQKFKWQQGALGGIAGGGLGILSYIGANLLS